MMLRQKRGGVKKPERFCPGFIYLACFFDYFDIAIPVIIIPKRL